MHKGKCGPAAVGFWLVIIGAVNWGLVGLGGFFDMNLNLVNLIFGSVEWLENVVYLLVGVSAVMMVVGRMCKSCKKDGGGCCGGGKCGPRGDAPAGDQPAS